MRSIRSSRAPVVALALVALLAAACHRSDEDTAGGAATVSVTPSPTPRTTGATGNTSAITGASGVSGSLGTSGGSGSTGASATANAVPVSAVEYEFRFDGEVPSGHDGFVLENDGSEPHELVLLQLDPGKTVEDVKALVDAGVPNQPPSWVTPVGQTFAKPGKTSKPLEADLDAGGTYVIACFVTTAKGVPHAALGMLEEVPVTG